MANNYIQREVAWRVFAREFNAANVELPGDDQYAPSYVVSPLGALINRVYLTGVLTECENVGTDLEPLWRGRVSDPTDTFYISAGQFQPKAARALAELEVPALVGISGKARTYSPDDGTTYVSVRVESVKEITQEMRDYWVLEACRCLHDRLEGMREAAGMEPPDVRKLQALGYSQRISSGIIEALNQFGEDNIEQYDEVLRNVLRELAMDTSMDVTIPKRTGIKTGLSDTGSVIDIDRELPGDDSESVASIEFATGVDLEFEPEGAKQATDTDMDMDAVVEDDEDSSEVTEQLILEIVNDLAKDSPDGVQHEDVQARAMEHGLDNAVIDECISSLIDKGIIYEPSIGVFKAV